MVKAIIFDCFGVLVGKSYWDIYVAAGGDAVTDHDFIESMLQKANSGAISNAVFSTIMAEKLGLSMAEYRQLIQREERPNYQLFEYIRTDLKPKYKIAMLSNVNCGVIERKIPPELRVLFDVEVLSAEAGVQKPDLRIYELTVDKLGVEYHEAVFTDDLPKYIAPAKELGMQTILYTGFDSFKTQLKGLLST